MHLVIQLQTIVGRSMRLNSNSFPMLMSKTLATFQGRKIRDLSYSRESRTQALNPWPLIYLA